MTRRVTPPVAFSDSQPATGGRDVCPEPGLVSVGLSS